MFLIGNRLRSKCGLPIPPAQKTKELFISKVLTWFDLLEISIETAFPLIKFNLIAKNAKRIIALGGINETNISRVKLTRSKAIASISWIKKTAQVNLGRFKFY